MSAAAFGRPFVFQGVVIPPRRNARPAASAKFRACEFSSLNPRRRRVRAAIDDGDVIAVLEHLRTEAGGGIVGEAGFADMEFGDRGFERLQRCRRCDLYIVERVDFADGERLILKTAVALRCRAFLRHRLNLLV